MLTSLGCNDAVLFWEEDLSINERINRINYLGVVYTLKAALPGMVKRGTGRVLMMSSLMATLGEKLASNDIGALDVALCMHVHCLAELYTCCSGITSLQQ